MNKLLLLLLLSASICGCSKSSDTDIQLESFAFTGRITDCRTGMPISGAHIHAREQSGSFGGFFNSSINAGDTYSDAQGVYRIVPTRLSGANWLELTIEKNGYSGAYKGFDPDQIKASGAKVITYDETLFIPQYGYIKVFATNMYPVDTDDLLHIRIVTHHADCSNYITTFVGGSSTASSDGDQFIKGVVQQAFVIDEVSGNDSVIVYYNVRRHNTYDQLKEIRTFVQTNDTTVLTINY